MAKRKQNSKKVNALVQMEFQLNEIVFAKQKGYVPWPAVITEFHPQKPRYAKVEFFAWDQRCYCISNRAFISFGNLLKIEVGKKIAENHPNNLRLQKAVQEMGFVFNVAERLLNERIGANGFECENYSQSNKNKSRINLKEPVISNLESINNISNRSESHSFELQPWIGLPVDVDNSLQLSSNKSKVATAVMNNSPTQPQNGTGTQTENQVSSNLKNVNHVLTRSATRQTVGIGKPAPPTIKTRSQSTKNMTNVKRKREFT